MKTFLFATDFSENAKHALDYAYSLATRVKANLVICNAVVIPEAVPQTGFIAWPADETDMLLNDSIDELKRLKNQLEKNESDVGFNPAITCANEAGAVTELVNNLGNYHDIGLVIIGTHGSDGLSTLLLGDHSRNMIDEINRPLLLVPPSAPIATVKKIAFATDFTDAAIDMEYIHALITLARPINAEILLTHICAEDEHKPEMKYCIDQFMIKIADNANYPNIYYREIKAYQPGYGLDWLCQHGDIDILAMVHRPHTFIDSLFRKSQTQEMANHIAIPLLVFPAK